MIRFIQFLFYKMRLSEPMLYKVPVLITVTYMVVWLGKIELIIATKYWALSLVTITGIAGIAYTFNDWADVVPDAVAGKSNPITDLTTVQKYILVLFFLALALLPWLIFPCRLPQLLLLAAELLLFWLYAFKPFRLKERAIAGVIADALYAHAIPALLAALTFGAVADTYANPAAISFASHYSLPLALLTLWQLALGIRNILLHQLYDKEKDLQAGTKTFVTVYGNAASQRLVKLFILAELILYSGMLLCWGTLWLYTAVAYLLFTGLSAYTNSAAIKPALKDSRSFAYLFIDNFYLDWFPIAVLTVLCISDIRLIVILVLHTVLFRNVVKQKLTASF